jgi:hypothetical protein
MMDEKLSSQRKSLPCGYQLNDNDVFCGRGSLCFNHIGNARFRAIVLANIPRYHSSDSKLEKSHIIQEVVEYIRSTSPNGGFVTKDIETGRYYEVGDNSAVSTLSKLSERKVLFTDHGNSSFYLFVLFLFNRGKRHRKHFEMQHKGNTNQVD